MKSADLSNVAVVNTGRNTVFCSLFVPFDPTLLILCEKNGHVSIYDFMTQTLKLEYNTLREAYSYTLLCGGKMLACGDKKHIFFFELETGKRIGFYRDIHSDVINHLVAHPSYPTVFASGSEDGLICVFDVARGNQDDAVVSIFQTDSGVANLNWFGANNELIWCASMTRGVSVWNSITGDRIACINDFCPLLSEKGKEVDYVVGCIVWRQSELFVLCGTQDGLGVITPIDHPEQIAAEWKGHESAIRCVTQVGENVITSGEDASVCIWSEKPVEKTEKSGGADRSRPLKNRKDKYRSV